MFNMTIQLIQYTKMPVETDQIFESIECGQISYLDPDIPEYSWMVIARGGGYVSELQRTLLSAFFALLLFFPRLSFWGGEDTT